MTQIYGARWCSQEGEPTEINGNDSARFKLWCEKTESLTDEQWQRGFRNVEARVRKKSFLGETDWPPTYAEFLGLCDQAEESDRAPEHRYFAPLGIEDKTAREKRRELALEKCKALKGIFE
jgi:hypothetical protein